MLFLAELRKIVGTEKVYENEPMSKHTTMKVGGPARYMVTPDKETDIPELIKVAGLHNIPYYVIGNGSNLLVSDEGYDGLIIYIGRNMSEISVEGNIIKADAGAMLSSLGAVALKNGLTGLEFAAGIPGTLGGACVMNAGAYGGEIKDVLTVVRAVDKDGVIHEFTPDEMKMSYRHSMFTEGGYIITGAVMELKAGNPEEISERMSEYSHRRLEKQPLEYPSAGSTFKRPEGYYAGALIEKAGLKGKGAGGACVSEKHAGFVINYNKATAKDVYDTINYVIDEVKKDSGVVLEPEVRIIGNF
jgi:UDP-N-acetylmuramate dehydrogenase